MMGKDITIEDAVSYRMPMKVTHILVLCNGTSYPICPRCNLTMDREYMNVCDHCGQKLVWKRFSYAEAVYAPRK